MKVKFLIVPNDDPWGDIYYSCGYCNEKVPSKFLERHADDMHGIKDIELVKV